LTTDIWITLTILLISVILFFSERVRVDLIALLVMGSLALTGVLSPADALSGFSNPAVVTVWAMFIISGALSRTGIANSIGRRIFGLAGKGEVRLIATIMLTAGVLSAFMNNVGVAALLLPVVMDLSKRTKLPPSKLLMPLAMGCLLGGMTTLIGTPPNILASEALNAFGLEPFHLFDFTPLGSIILFCGVLFVVLVGRYLLPTRNISKELRDTSLTGLEQVYDLSQDMYIVKVPPDSLLSGKSLAESRFGTVLAINVIGIIRNGKTRLAPGADEVIESGDQLIVSGGIDQLSELHGRQYLVVEKGELGLADLISEEIKIKEVLLSPDSKYVGQTVKQINFRNQFGVVVLATQREGHPYRTDLDQYPLKAGELLLVHGEKSQIERLLELQDFSATGDEDLDVYRVQERLLMARIPRESRLCGKPLSESRLSETLGLTVLGIVRDGSTFLLPPANELLADGDILILKGKEENLDLLQGLQELEIDKETTPDIKRLDSEQVGLIETGLSPHTTLSGMTLRQIHFREKYGLSVLGIWRAGSAYRSNLSEIPLQFGDALLLFGRRERLTVLGSEPDFLVLTEEIQAAPRVEKAPIASLIMVAIILSVLFGWIPIAIAGVLGSAAMVLSGSLTMEEAYRYIDWRSVFLIAGLIPLGLAMQTSGAASLIADTVLGRIGEYGPMAILAGLFLLTSITSQVMPNSVVTVLMAPIAINTAANMHISAHSLMMAVAIAASAAFLSPVAHPANILIMGPGGYRVKDYIRVGLPLTLLVFLIVLVLLPIFWPF
jgi:di/tricarboxylate transporter